jgi:hypothetical protein
MTNSEEIHLSVAEADDLEEIHEPTIPLSDVFRSLVQHPAQIITRWNWKAALLGALLRASFYFSVYKAAKENWLVILSAVLVEFSFRFFTSGISGALVQSFRRATPAWLATLIVTVSLPIFSHTVEYVAHYTQETYFSAVLPASENNSRRIAFAVSVLFSVMSAMFNLFIMRHGVLLVGAGAETKSLWSDLKKIPFLVFEFVTYLPIKILQSLSGGNLALAAAMFGGFGLTVGFILGVFRGKWSWAWTTALGAWAILLTATVLVAIGLQIMKRSRARN